MKTWIVRVLLPALAVVCPPGVVRADIRLPAVVGSHMVLQRDLPLPIWGWAEPGEEVTVTFGGHQAAAKADSQGKWRVTLPAMKSGGGPQEMTLAGKNTVKLEDILLGEVWVGSGQSNMQWSVKVSTNSAAEIAAAKYPEIRLFTVPMVPSGTPAKDVNAKWVACSPETVPDFSAVLYFFGRELHKDLKVPIGLINTSWGGTRIEPWIPPEGFDSQPSLQTEIDELKNAPAAYAKAKSAHIAAVRAWLEAAEKAAAAGEDLPPTPVTPAHPLNSNGKSTGLYNGMIHPIVPFAIRGAIWYQGESNVTIGMKYHTLMKALIQGWRTVWHEGDFPFLYVQLAPFKYGRPSKTDLPEIWEAQTATLSYPNTGMAVTTDLVEKLNDIHPPNKQDVGKRLALWALANTYGKSGVVFSGPLYESKSVEGNKIQLKFKHAAGLAARDGKPLTWFSIAGADKKFVPAEATISGETIVVQSPDVANPVAVRFGWDESAEPNLVNKAGLPASPFRTDNWTDAVQAPVAAK